MEAWKLLVGSDIGLLSLATIVGVLVIGAYMGVYFKKEAEKDAKNAK